MFGNLLLPGAVFSTNFLFSQCACASYFPLHSPIIKKYLEAPSYQLHDVYRALSLLAGENDLIQSEVFIDGDGIPLACSIFPGNQNEQTSLRPLESKILQQFGCEKFIYCRNAELASQANRNFNHVGNCAFIVTQSIKKLRSEDKELALTGKAHSENGFAKEESE